jgi:hypothetical protein
MKKITIIALSFLLFASGFANAQSVKYPTRSGIVYEIKEVKNGKERFKYYPLSDVKIFIEQNASNSSEEDGKFTLTPRKVPFKIIEVKRKGYDLVSPNISNRLYSDNKDVIEVVMVNSITRKSVKENAKQDTEISISERKNKEKKEVQKLVNAGKITQEEKLKRLNEIDEKYEKINKFVDEFLETYSYDYFNKMSERTEKLYEFLLEGKFEQFDSLILKGGDLKKRKEKVKSLKELSDNESEALSKEYN